MLTINVSNFAKAIIDPWYKEEFLTICKVSGIQAFTLKGWYQFTEQAARVAMTLTRKAEANYPHKFEEAKRKALFVLEFQQRGIESFYELYQIKGEVLEGLELKIIQNYVLNKRQDLN